MISADQGDVMAVTLHSQHDWMTCGKSRVGQAFNGQLLKWEFSV